MKQLILQKNQQSRAQCSKSNNKQSQNDFIFDSPTLSYLQ